MLRKRIEEEYIADVTEILIGLTRDASYSDFGILRHQFFATGAWVLS